MSSSSTTEAKVQQQQQQQQQHQPKDPQQPQPYHHTQNENNNLMPFNFLARAFASFDFYFQTIYTQKQKNTVQSIMNPLLILLLESLALAKCDLLPKDFVVSHHSVHICIISDRFLSPFRPWFAEQAEWQPMENDSRRLRSHRWTWRRVPAWN